MFKKVWLAQCFLILPSLLGGCAPGKEQLLSVSAYINELKGAILIANECAKSSKLPTLFTYENMDIAFDTTAIKETDKTAKITGPLVGMIPAQVGLVISSTVSDQQVQKVTLHVHFIQSGPGELEINSPNDPSYVKTNISTAYYSKMADQLFFFFRDSNGSEHWLDMKLVHRIQVTPSGEAQKARETYFLESATKYLTPEEIQRYCRPRKDTGS